MRERISAPIFFIFISLSVCFSQTTSFLNFGVEQGLAQSQVQTIGQDKDGNLWIGTMGGLSRYNGKTFKNFSRKDSLAEDWVTASYNDKDGNFWLGHWGGVFRATTFL